MGPIRTVKAIMPINKLDVANVVTHSLAHNRTFVVLCLLSLALLPHLINLNINKMSQYQILKA